jgi:uncharacterized membrane protein YidH (DUF202 family)
MAESDSDAIIINEIQLILAEKRTSLASLRTGIAVMVLPLSVLSVLIATSRYYDIIYVKTLFIPLMLLNLALIILGSYLIVRSIIRIHHHDRIIKKIKGKHSRLAEFID